MLIGRKLINKLGLLKEGGRYGAKMRGSEKRRKIIKQWRESQTGKCKTCESGLVVRG